jgi:hypothetical protein
MAGRRIGEAEGHREGREPVAGEGTLGACWGFDVPCLDRPDQGKSEAADGCSLKRNLIVPDAAH